MKNTDALFSLADDMEEKISKNIDSNTMDAVKSNLYKMNIPMVELVNLTDSLLKESQSQLDSGNLDTTKYDLATEIHQLTRQYIRLFRKFI